MENRLPSDYAAILNIFVSDDDMEPHFLRPFTINGYAMATDAQCRVFFQKNLCSCIDLFTGFNAAAIISSIPTERNSDFRITVATLQVAINCSPLVDEFLVEKKVIKCDACDGRGEVEYEFQHGGKRYLADLGCPKCEGEGEIINEVKIPTGKQVIDLDGFVKIRISTFSIRNLLKLIEAARILKQDVITLTYMVREFGTSVFKIGDIEVLVAAAAMLNSEPVVCHIV